MNQELLTRFEDATKTLMQHLASLTEAQWNTLPFEGSWTPGQLADHLYKSYNILYVLNGNVKDIHRDPTEKLTEIDKTFKDFSIKMDSPEMVLPRTGYIQKDHLMTGLQKRIDQQRDAIKTLDLSKTCLDAEIPGGGPFTRHEWLGFNAIHTERHNHQLGVMIQHL